MTTFLSRAWLVIAALAVSGAAPGGEPDYPRETVVMLVAPWCAPCHAELARFDAIEPAARPYRVVAFQVETGAAATRMMAGVREDRRWQPAPGHRDRVSAFLMRRTPGLPYAFAVDAGGAICAERHGGLDAARVSALVARCRAATVALPERTR